MDSPAEVARLRGPRRRVADANGTELAEVAIPFGSAAPGAARTVIERCPADQVASSVLEKARMLMSELVTRPSHRISATAPGLGPNIVQMLSERWGVVRVGEGPTRVWTQLSCAPTAADARAGANGGPPAATRSA